MGMNKRIDTWLPIILFTLIGLSVFFTERQDGGSVDGSMYGSTSAHGLTLSKNLFTGDHQFFMFSSRELINGKIVYDAYNRFPVFPFLLTGLLIQPFDNNLSFQIYIARQLMNLFFFLSILVVFKLVNELVKNKYIAISIAFITFSSYYMLSYNDMIFNDTPALLGYVIALYCVVISQKKKLSAYQIIFFALFPVSLGWQPYAVFGVWLIMDFIELLLEKKSLREKLVSLIKKPSFIVMILAIIWGTLILSFQIFNEWRIIGGSFADLPSVSSALWRSGLVSAEGRTSFIWAFDWFTYLPGQFKTITIMLVPFWPVFQIDFGINASIFIVVILIIYNLLKYFKDKSSLNKVHLILIFSGFLWTIPMKHFVALHDFQSIFYIGFAISVYLLLFSQIKLHAWNLLAFNIAIVFIISITLSNYYKASYSGSFAKPLQSIYEKLPKDSKVYFDGDRRRMTGFTRYGLDLYMSNSIYSQKEEADYVITKEPVYDREKLTSNPGFNLYKLSRGTK